MEIAVYKDKTLRGFFDLHRSEQLGEMGSSEMDVSESGSGAWVELRRLSDNCFVLLERTWCEMAGPNYGLAELITRQGAVEWLLANNIRPPDDLLKDAGLIDFTKKTDEEADKEDEQKRYENELYEEMLFGPKKKPKPPPLLPSQRFTSVRLLNGQTIRFCWENVIGHWEGWERNQTRSLRHAQLVWLRSEVGVKWFPKASMAMIEGDVAAEEPVEIPRGEQLTPDEVIHWLAARELKMPDDLAARARVLDVGAPILAANKPMSPAQGRQECTNIGGNVTPAHAQNEHSAGNPLDPTPHARLAETENLENGVILPEINIEEESERQHVNLNRNDNLIPALPGSGEELKLIPGGFTLGAKHHDFSGRPRDMLAALLNADNRRMTAEELRNALAIDDDAVNYPDQVVKDTANKLRKALKNAALEIGLSCDNPLPSSGKGKDLTYILAIS